MTSQQIIGSANRIVEVTLMALAAGKRPVAENEPLEACKIAGQALRELGIEDGMALAMFFNREASDVLQQKVLRNVYDAARAA